MSQAKVDKYKQDKKKRAQIMKKQKRNAMIAKIAGGIVAVVLVCWIGVSIYNVVNPETSSTYTVDAAALDDYLNQLTAESETDAEESTEASTETGSEESTEASTESGSEETTEASTESEEATEAATETEEVTETAAESETESPAETATEAE
ncbi:MAG TPA: hypothetical protein IAB26_07690 [Candidatus Limivivens merdigallinarum]|uniref:Uncharacterized protein n=1 Tax=Candidatus Limivivens merdigallinarum TaxID=2840859 RepID=A0A9D1D0U5_9FIRM|nr:hypothetical protein [Candidatus Limivivens merdigallinarum]